MRPQTVDEMMAGLTDTEARVLARLCLRLIEVTAWEMGTYPHRDLGAWAGYRDPPPWEGLQVDGVVEINPQERDLITRLTGYGLRKVEQ